MNHAVVCFLIFLVNIYLVTTLEDQQHWKNLGIEDIEAALKQQQNIGLAKNVILFIGDGMGPTTTTAARIYSNSEKHYLSFEKFPNVGVLKTYSADQLVPDSCSTATALFCGVKANVKTSGVDATVKYGDCAASLNKEAQLDSLISWAQAAGKRTGFVTTTRVTHATPSALYAHSPNRNWECESKMSPNASQCKDIARQLIEDLPGRNINVIMGGGRQCLVSDVTGTSDDPIDTWSCFSRDGRNLIEDWKISKSKSGVSHAVVANNNDLNTLKLNTEYVLGIFANGHLKMNHERNPAPHGMPSLTNMTEKAILLLQNNRNGFFLMVEGGMIDFAHHRGHARQALSETVEFSNAVQKAVELTKKVSYETLIIVTADHSHSLVFTGSAKRSVSILGADEKSEIDNIPYTTLLYGTGGGNNYQFEVVDNTMKRRNPQLDDTISYDYSQQAAVLVDEVKHSGTDVIIYAVGPMAHLFHNVHEQTYVAYVISYAAKIGPFAGNGGENVSFVKYLLISVIIINCFVSKILRE
ncbi:hypothetical protein RN001_014053 [Aquatica leii]|uniref:alkaline phosphatase n=1 Tax=Aquatica leii TaxID=1421715 RepID=A0AAN7SLV6_9COLE|nr:hypothetical protein RN001_014053 [Aquatica leii]